MEKKSILIADDSEKLLSALRLQLEAYGFDVRTCTDSYNALAQAKQRPPDVMLLDIRMPAGDGFSVLERMQKQPELCKIPIIYITGEKSSELDLKAEQMGARGVIHKPISVSALLQAIKTAIEASDRGASGESDGTELKEFDVSADSQIPEILRQR